MKKSYYGFSPIARRYIFGLKVRVRNNVCQLKSFFDGKWYYVTSISTSEDFFEVSCR